MKKILLFGAGKSATVLISYLINEATNCNWTITIADVDRELILLKTDHSPVCEAIGMDITNDEKRGKLIEQASIVISMMPPALHFLIAKDCVEYGKNLLTASYLDSAVKSLETEINNKQLLFICEMGLDPGIDHMSAMKIMDEIKAKGGKITSFKSHCGGLVAPESDDNPLHYKVSWNPRNIVLAGKTGAEYKINNEIIQKKYADLFSKCNQVNIDGAGNFATYPNRDSLSYLPIYKLEDIPTFIRTTLRHPNFCKAWEAIVKSDLTNDTIILNTNELSYVKWSAATHPFINQENKGALLFLGLFDNTLVPSSAKTSADIMQFIVETKLVMKSTDKDMIVMLHEISYQILEKETNIESSLIVIGENNLYTAMAKTVGLPLGIAAKLILNSTIQLTGLHIPTVKEIYDPVLKELANYGIAFNEHQV